MQENYYTYISNRIIITDQQIGILHNRIIKLLNDFTIRFCFQIEIWIPEYPAPKIFSEIRQECPQS